MTNRIALLGLSSIIALAAVPAHAQSAAPAVQDAPATPPAAADDGNNGEIIVTAQLTKQNQIDVPFALTAYSGRFLNDLGITEFDRLSRYVPGFVVQNQSPNNPGFVIRGITSDSGSAFNEPRVSVFQDGVSISKSRGSYVELFDIERVEVAKGPQSTLYGRGALIGAVNVIEAKADPSQYEGYFYGSYGNYSAYRIDGTVNVPITDTLAIRAAGRVKKRDGYVDDLLGSDRSGNGFNGIQTDAGRVSLRWAPSKLTVDVIGNYQHDTATGTSFKSIAYDPTDPVTGAVIGDRGRNSGAALAPAAGFEGGKPLGLNREVWGVTGIADYAFDSNWSLNVLGSYRRFDALEVFDADGISLPVLTAAEDARGNQTMTTARLTYKNDRVTAFFGATYFHEDGSQRAPAVFNEAMALARLTGTLNGGGAIPGRPSYDPAPAALFSNPAFTGQLLQGVIAAQTGLTIPQVAAAVLPTAQAQAIAANLHSHVESSTNYARTNSVDLFGDVSYKITPKFEVGAGLRWSHDDKSTGYVSTVADRSILGGFIGALSSSAATRTALLQALAVPGAANIPTSALYPVPMFGLGLQPTNGRVDQDFSDSGFTWRATAKYELSDQANLYLNYGRGRRPKLLSVSPPGLPGAAPTFEVVPAETVDSFEGGVKTALVNRTLFVDGAVYYYKYNNFQTTEQIGTTFITTNAGKADSYGFEGQVRWVPLDYLTVFGTYAFNHGRFQEGARKGNQFRLAPDHALSGGFTLKAPLGNDWRVDFSPSVTWQSKIFFDDDNDRPDLQAQNLVPDLIQDEYQKGYALVDARFGLEPGDGRFRIEAFVTNLFDKKYIKDAGNTGDSLGLPTFIAGEPRFYGISISFRGHAGR